MYVHIVLVGNDPTIFRIEDPSSVVLIMEGELTTVAQDRLVQSTDSIASYARRYKYHNATIFTLYTLFSIAWYIYSSDV